MESILLKLADQLPVAVLFLIAVGYGLNLFTKFLRERENQWQAFLKEQQEINDKRIAIRDDQRREDRKTIADLVNATQQLAQGISDFRKDFDRAVVKMEERTRPGKDK